MISEIDEGIEDLGLEIARQPPFLLRPARIFETEAIGAHDLLGKLLAAKGEIPRVDDAQVTQHAEGGAAGAEASQQAGAEDEQVFRVEVLDFRGDPVPEQLGVGAQAPR